MQQNYSVQLRAKPTQRLYICNLYITQGLLLLWNC